VARQRKNKGRRILFTGSEHCSDPLDQEEIRESGVSLARILTSLEELDVEKKAALAEFKQKKLELDLEVVVKRNEVNTGKRIVLVETEEVLDLKRVETVRTDTGEVIRSRRATSNELQGTLYGIDDEREDIK